MDLRARLILALSPLLVALGIIGVIAVVSQQRVSNAINDVNKTARDLVEVAQGESLILLEQYYVSEILAGHWQDRSIIEQYRNELRSFFNTYTQRGDIGFVELELAARYENMATLHDAALVMFDRGNQDEALAMLNSQEYHRNVRAIHSLVIGAQREYEVRYQREITALERIVNERFWIASAIVGSATIIALALALGLNWQVGRIVEQLTTDAEHYARAETHGQLRPVGSIRQLQRLRDAFQHLLDTNAARQQQLMDTMQAQQAQLEREIQLQATIRALSLPVTSLGPHTLFLPLIGHLDATRSEQLINSLLQAIHQRRARAVVIDIHGLATLDETTRQSLIRVGQSARLLGARVILVGARAEQALQLADLPANLFSFARDIPAALAIAT